MRTPALLLSLLALAACSDEPARAAAPLHPDGYETLELRYQGSTGQVLFPEIAEEPGEGVLSLSRIVE